MKVEKWPRTFEGETWAITSFCPTLDPKSFRGVYEWLLTVFSRFGHEPHAVSVDKLKGFRPTHQAKWNQRSRDKLDRADFTTINTLSFSLSTDREIGSAKDNLYGVRIAQDDEYLSVNHSFMYFRSSELRLSVINRNEIFREFADRLVHRYGYAFRIGETFSASSYARFSFYSLLFVSEHEEEYKNCGWDYIFDAKMGSVNILRNIYTMNFLTKPYLDLRVHDKTLEQWIMADDAHGTLIKINDRVTLWSPPDENISKIREELFRAGIVFYYKFFNIWDDDNPWKRDFTKPWKCPDEIPRIFQTGYRHAIDPPLR